MKLLFIKQTSCRTTPCLHRSAAGSPKDFMIEQLLQLKKAKSEKRNYPCIFDEGNLEAVFRMLDPTGRGFITVKQFQEGTSLHYIIFKLENLTNRDVRGTLNASPEVGDMSPRALAVKYMFKLLHFRVLSFRENSMRFPKKFTSD